MLERNNTPPPCLYFTMLVASLVLTGIVVSGFSPPHRCGPMPLMRTTKQRTLVHGDPLEVKPLFMAVEPSATQGSSAEEQCAPEEGEYCVIDQRTGKLIKLTIAEKERIFLDALQVRSSRKFTFWLLTKCIPSFLFLCSSCSHFYLH